MRSVTVPTDLAALRLDLFLASHVPGCSRRTAQRAIATGAVRVNGRRSRKGQTVHAGDAVEAPETLFVPPALQPNPVLAVPVLYEDAAVIALDKPAGMPSHALRASETATAANFLLARYPEVATVGKHLEAGVAHRLDTETSGVLLAARTQAAYASLRGQFSTHRVTKEYLALVEGEVVAAGEIRVPIAPRDRRTMRVCTGGTGATRARPAVTAYSPIERLGSRTLLAVQITTGVMHQIRVHLASIGHPIVGDRLYGGAVAPRHFLHACRVTFSDPETGTPIEVRSPLPADLGAALDALRKKRRVFTSTTGKAQHR